MANKIDRMVTYSEEFPLVELHDPSIMWCCGITLQIKDFLSPFGLDQWPPNMARWRLTGLLQIRVLQFVANCKAEF